MTRSSSQPLLGALILGAIACLWLVPIASALWLDETVTRWVVDTDLAGLVPRAIEYQWSPLYFLLPWASLRTGLASQEVLLRAPSILAMTIACVGVFRIGRRLWDVETGLLAVLVFVTTESVAFAAVDARPHATGLALAVFSMERYLLWRDTDLLGHEVASVGLAALAVYTQPLFGLVFAVQGGDLLLAMVRERLPARPLVLHGTLIVLVLAPMTPIFLRLAQDRESLSWAHTPSLLDLAGALAPPALCLTLVFGLIAGRVFGTATAHWRTITLRGPVRTLLVWWLLPIVGLFVVSRVSATELFVAKYFLTAAPAFALLVAGGMRHFATEALRTFIAIGVALVIVPQLFSTTHRTEGWREVARAIPVERPPAATPILVRGGLVESLRPDWLADPERREYLLAPLAAYPIEGVVIPLPAHVGTPQSRHYMDVTLARRLAGVDEFLSISARGFGVDVWLRRWAKQQGYRRTRVGLYGVLEVSRFSR